MICKIIEKIDLRLKKSSGKVITFHNNLISGIIGGLIFTYIIFYSLELKIQGGIWLGAIIFIVFYTMGKWIISHSLKNTTLNKKKHLEEYKHNIIASVVGASYVWTIYLFLKQGKNYLLHIAFLTGALILVTILILYFIVARKTK